MHWLLLLAAASTQPPPVRVGAAREARATGRIVRFEQVSREWNDRAPVQRREILIRESDGRMTRLRLVEHE